MGDIMARIFPKDDNSRAAGSRAKAIAHYRFNADHWEYRDSTGVDVGIDCCFELTENDEWTGNTIECQVKGRTRPDYNATNTFISLEMRVSTINYALSKASAVLVLLVDLKTETVFYLPIQEYFIANPSLFNKLQGRQQMITLRIPTDNVVTDEDIDLQEIAKSRYTGGPTSNLHKAT